MSRTLRKAVEAAKARKETELILPDEGVANLEDVPELCEWHGPVLHTKTLQDLMYVHSVVNMIRSLLIAC